MDAAISAIYNYITESSDHDETQLVKLSLLSSKLNEFFASRQSVGIKDTKEKHSLPGTQLGRLGKRNLTITWEDHNKPNPEVGTRNSRKKQTSKRQRTQPGNVTSNVSADVSTEVTISFAQAFELLTTKYKNWIDAVVNLGPELCSPGRGAIIQEFGRQLTRHGLLSRALVIGGGYTLGHLILIRAAHVHVFHRWNCFQPKESKRGGGFHYDKFADSLGLDRGWQLSKTISAGRRLARLGHLGPPLCTTIVSLSKASEVDFEQWLSCVETIARLNARTSESQDSIAQAVVKIRSAKDSIDQMLEHCQRIFDTEMQTPASKLTAGACYEFAEGCQALSAHQQPMESDSLDSHVSEHHQRTPISEGQFSLPHGQLHQTWFDVENTNCEYNFANCTYGMGPPLGFVDLANINCFSGYSQDFNPQTLQDLQMSIPPG